jgi:hypothetical protein
LRIREGDPNFARELFRGFARLFDLYGDSVFSISVTANAVLRNRDDSARSTYSVWYGQSWPADDFYRTYNFRATRLDSGEDEEADGRPPTISNLGEVSKLETRFSAHDFQQLFLANHSTSAVTVDQLINIVYLIERNLDSYARDKVTRGRAVVRIY